MRRSLRFILCALLLLAPRAGAQQPAANSSEAEEPLRVTFLDVGQGDAVLVRTPSDAWVLVDAGPGSWTPPGVGGRSDGRNRAGRSPASRRGPHTGEALVPRLQALGVDTLSLLVASHAHADHIGGMEAVLRGVPVKAFMDNGIPYTTRTYLSLMRALRARPDIRYLRPVARTVRLGDAELRVLPPPEGTDDQNDGSVGLLLAYGRFRALLTGDSERKELSRWLAADRVPRVTLLKAPHHGSANGFTPAFLAAAQPRVVVISVGPNPYGHPMPRALVAYGGVAREVYRTDRDGDVAVFGWKDGRWRVRTGRAASRRRGDPAGRRGAARDGSADPALTNRPRTGSRPREERR